MGQASRNPMSAQGKKGAARDAARLRQYLAGCCGEGELRAFVDSFQLSPAEKRKMLEVCWPLTTFGANEPFPGGPTPEAGN